MDTYTDMLGWDGLSRSFGYGYVRCVYGIAARLAPRNRLKGIICFIDIDLWPQMRRLSRFYVERSGWRGWGFVFDREYIYI